MKRTAILTLALGALVMGCSPPGTAGELGRGNFLYRCSSDADYSCFYASPFLGHQNEVGRVGVGQSFILTFEGADVVPASPTLVEGRGRFRFLAEAEVAFMAVDLDGEVVDLLHVTATEPAEAALQLERDEDFSFRVSTEPLPPDTVEVGEEASLIAYTHSANGAPLLGSPTCAWSSDDEGVIDLRYTGTDCLLRFEALAVGSATITVDVGGLVDTRTITVVEAPSDEEAQP